MTAPDLAARLSAVLGRHVAGYEQQSDVLIELLTRLETIRHEETEAHRRAQQELGEHE